MFPGENPDGVGLVVNRRRGTRPDGGELIVENAAIIPGPDTFLDLDFQGFLVVVVCGFHGVECRLVPEGS
jgi:hypothetical protein